MDDVFKMEYYDMFEINTDKQQWYKLLCYYYAKTELYDRTLTNARSPYDVTEAYITCSTHRIASNLYAKKTRQEVLDMAESLNMSKDYISFNHGYKNYSAQRWIDEYEMFRKDGAYEFY